MPKKHDNIWSGWLPRPDHRKRWWLEIHSDKKIATKLLRARIKDKLLGLSTHNELEILEANSLEGYLGSVKEANLQITKNLKNPLNVQIKNEDEKENNQTLKAMGWEA